jgi:hypothetical protein
MIIIKTQSFRKRKPSSGKDPQQKPETKEESPFISSKEQVKSEQNTTLKKINL